jgi:hypothetical protein
MTSESILLVRRTTIVGMIAGIVFAAVTSSCILAERLARGDSRVALWASATVASAAMIVLALTLRPFRTRFGAERSIAGVALHRVRAVSAILAQSLGALLGVMLVHFVLRACLLEGRPWLCERSPQLVNDLVATFGALLLVWGAAHRPLGALASIAAVGIAVAYAVTSSHWHLDAPVLPAVRSLLGASRGVSVSVQSSVLAQLACIAVGVGAFRLRPSEGARHA